MAALWRIRFDGKEIGPYPYPVFLLLRSQGRMPPNTEAKREGSADWVPFDAASEDPDAQPAAIPTSLPAPSVNRPPPLPQRRHAEPPPLPLRGNARLLAADKAPPPKNFWPAFTGFAVLPLLLLAAAAVVAIDHSRSAYDPRPWMAFTVSISVLIVAHWFGSSWWIWRRTAGFSSEAKRICLRASSVLYGLMMLGFVFAQQGVVFNLWKFAVEPDKFSDFSISASPAEHAIVFRGPLGFDATDRFRKVLAEHPDADTLVIDSPGGWIVAARGVASLMAASRLHTVLVRNQCASACTLIFEQARHRIIEQGAHLGFHSGHNDLLDNAPGKEASNREFIAVLCQRDIPRAVIDRIVATPNSSMWWPGDHELFSDGLIDAIRLDGKDLAGPDYFAAQADSVLASPATAQFYQSLRLFDPKTYAELRTVLADSLATPASSTDLKTTTAKLVTPSEDRAFAHGGDAAQQRRARFVAQLLIRLRPTSPHTCVEFWGGNHALSDLKLTATEKTEFLAMMGELMRSGAMRPDNGDGQQPDRQVLLRVYGRATRLYGNAVSHTRAAQLAGQIRDDDVCAMAILTFSAIADLPQGDAGKVMRWLAVER